MTYDIDIQGHTVIVSVAGRLDASTAPELEPDLLAVLEDASDVTIDLEELEYISSAGLRLLLVAHKRMNKQGTMVVANAHGVVLEMLDMSGFSAIFTLVWRRHRARAKPPSCGSKSL